MSVERRHLCRETPERAWLGSVWAVKEAQLPLGSMAMEWEHRLEVEGFGTNQRRWAWLGFVGIEGEARWSAALGRGVAALLGFQINWTQRRWNKSDRFWQSERPEG
ncbi:hypothetical protein M0R45_035571 [Rubus argutus]|uniref:Uncharacterized protein n=1 Tax=Rubus argutus TaxID=59490 RepID=A0AAW1VVA3_RUBAR